MHYDERKSMLCRRIKDSLPDNLLVNEGDVMPLGVDTPTVPYNADLSQYLDDLLLIAQGIILDERFPFAEQERPDDVEEMYHVLQVMVAVEVFNKEGYEGLKNYSENGISQSYSSADISLALIARITPKVCVL